MNMSRSKVAEEELEYESTEAQPGIGHRRRTMRDYLHWILRRLWVVVLTMVAGIILGFYVYKKTPKTYASMVTIQVDRQESAARIDTNDQDVNLSGEAFINTLAQKFSHEDARGNNAGNWEILLPLRDLLEVSESGAWMPPQLLVHDFFIFLASSKVAAATLCRF